MQPTGSEAGKQRLKELRLIVAWETRMFVDTGIVAETLAGVYFSIRAGDEEIVFPMLVSLLQYACNFLGWISCTVISALLAACNGQPCLVFANF